MVRMGVVNSLEPGI